ncbi:hypothetical protein ACB092_12G012300 [Castanea dentata]
MSTQGPSTSSPVSSSTLRRKYDVFLSFRGVDTRKSFTDHLYAALQRKGILTFRDDEKLERGKSISSELLTAIKESRFAIIIFSRNYASSTWCLNELAQIVRCMKETGLTTFPVFYDIDPSDVRKQTGTFGQAFDRYEECFKENAEKVKTWRAALKEVANLSGWHLQDRHESEFIQHIAEVVLLKLSSSFPSISNDLVGIDSSVEELINSYLGLQNNVCMIGICGMGGLGKTTLARVVYDKFCTHFEGSSFIANVREDSKKHGLPRLQQQLLAEILEEGNIDIRNVYCGVDMIKKRLYHKKVLLVLDDVNQLDQLEKLAGDHGWFGLGSWIIITTRDEHLLAEHGVHKVYKPNTLKPDDALKLFCLKAFKNELPKKGYMQLSQEVVYYSKCLPLALVILGSFLVGRTMDEWQSALENFKKIPKKEIFDILKVSFDGLDEMWKGIFLDIACFFRGEMKNRVIKILEYCGFDARIGISVLIDKSLLTIEGKKLWMHDLLQEMGREIVCQESRGEPGKRSRLWHRKDLFHVLMKDTATESIQAIVLNSPRLEEDFQSFEDLVKPFSKMCNLRLLIIDFADILNGINYLSNDLRFLEWFDYRSKKCLPPSFRPRELGELILPFSHIKYLWHGVKYLHKLKCIDLRNSEDLIQTPNLIGVPILERLYLSWCSNLVKIHPSVGQLSMLIILELDHCHSLTNLPRMTTRMESLTTLSLRGCSKIRKIPKFEGILKSLSKLNLSETAIGKLPSSIECLTALTLLDLRNCKNLYYLPSNMGSLKSLEKLVLSGCSQLANLPEKIWEINCLKELDLSRTGLRQPFKRDFSAWSSFSVLEEIRLNIGHVSSSSLKYLALSRNKFVTLPATINQLSKLETLDLCQCDQLRELPELPSTVRYLNARGCYSLESSPAILKTSSSFRPHSLLGQHDESKSEVAFTILNRYLQGLLCRKTEYEPYTKRKEDRSRFEFQLIIPGSKIPQWLTHKSVENSIRIVLPPNWSNSRWMGFALCACLCAPYMPTTVEAFGMTSGLRVRVMTLGDMQHSHCVSEIFFGMTLGANHICLLYLSRDDLFATGWKGECSQFEVVFEATNPSLVPQKCGVRLIYEQDVEGFKQSIAQRRNGRDITYKGSAGNKFKIS